MTALRWWPVSAALALAGAGLLVSGTSGAAGPPQPAGRGDLPVGVSAPPLADGPDGAFGGLLPAGADALIPGPGRAGSSTAASGRAGTATRGRGAVPGAVRLRAVPLPASRPVSLEVPAIGLRTPLASLGLTPDGLIDVPPPTKGSPAGWYRYSRTPGEPGSAVIVGHVDSAHDGPAVFFRLGELVPGDRITVHRADGSAAVFTVRRTAVVPKDRFPAADVYGPTRWPVLRLVTCGGSFDHLRGHYRDNLVVFATLTGTVPAP